MTHNPPSASPTLTVLRLTPSSHGLPRGLSHDEWHNAVLRAAASWSAPQVPCTSLRIEVAPLVGDHRAERDTTNLLVFRDEKWCHDGRCDPGHAFPALAAAMTTTYPPGARGRQVEEADIEINVVGYSFALGLRPDAALRVGTESRVVSLHALLLHEVGHAVGLEDECSQHAVTGDLRVVNCPAAERDSVMFAQAMHTELTPRDVDLVCGLFPVENTPTPLVAETHASSVSVEEWSPVLVPLAAVAGLGIAWRLLARGL